MKKILLILLFASTVNAQWLDPFNTWFSSSGIDQYALDFDGSTEYLSCTPSLRLTSEICATKTSITADSSFASNNIYGAWAFTLNKTGDNDVIDVYFINDVSNATSNSGYLLKYGNDEKIYLYSVASGTATARITSSGT